VFYGEFKEIPPLFGCRRFFKIQKAFTFVPFLTNRDITRFFMEEKQTNEPHQLNIELSEEMAEGVYANLAIITHSNAEFVVDFVNVMPGTPKAKVKSRIILTPQHAKRFMKALVDNIKKYESTNGSIQDQEPINIPMNFGGPAAQA
jgi:hypothetical protein